jgi:hypothetical protein
MYQSFTLVQAETLARPQPFSSAHHNPYKRIILSGTRHVQHTSESSAPMLFALAIKPIIIIVFIKYEAIQLVFAQSPVSYTGGYWRRRTASERICSNRSCRISGMRRSAYYVWRPQQYIFSSLLTNRVSSAFPSCFLPFLPTILTSSDLCCTV